MPYSLWDRIWPLLMVVAIMLVVFGVPILVIRKMRRDRAPGSATWEEGGDGEGAARERCMARGWRSFEQWMQANPGADPGPSVKIVFHTYSGIMFLTADQVRHDMNLPSEAARIILKEMLRFNMVHGVFGAACIFAPLISYIEYRSQLRNIARQERIAAEASSGRSATIG